MLNLLDFSKSNICDIKDKQLVIERYSYYFDIIKILMLSKFKIKNCPKNIYSDEILKSLMFGGTSAMTSKMSNGKNFVGVPIETDITEYSDRYDKAQLINPLSESKVLKQHEEIAVGYNNLLHTPEYDIVRFAKILAETDTSMYCNVMNSRLSPILLADDNNQKIALDTAIQNVYSGKLSSIAFNDIVAEINANGTKENRHILHLTEPKNIEKLQYLSKFHDDLIRRLCNLHGVTMNTTGKMAQLTQAELNEYSQFSGIYIQQQYDLLCEYIDEANRIENWNMSVEYADSFKRFMKKDMRVDELISEKFEESSEIENEKMLESEELENEDVPII